MMQGNPTLMPRLFPDALESPPAFTDEDAHILFPVPHIPPTPHGSPPVYSRTALPAAVALPQISPGYDQSFARGYHAAMAESGVQMEDWLHFIDALNVAMVRYLSFSAHSCS
jgi:hypothetical protein